MFGWLRRGQSLPRQRHQPPTPPAKLRAGLGPGDFWKTGEQTVRVIADLAGLEPHDRVLDIGCGLGRIAWPLSFELGEQGTYLGFDAVRPYIKWCRRRLRLPRGRFAFHHADLWSRSYNPHGRIRAEHFRFPTADDSIDLVIATSLFTHLNSPATEHYLAETKRALAPGGRAFLTFFLADDVSLPKIEAGDTYPKFEHTFENGWLKDREVPEDAVAFHREWLQQAVERAGLTISSVHEGQWRGIEAPSYQDVVIARA